jgi:hypothetical protein
MIDGLGDGVVQISLTSCYYAFAVARMPFHPSQHLMSSGKAHQASGVAPWVDGCVRTGEVVGTA